MPDSPRACRVRAVGRARASVLLVPLAAAGLLCGCGGSSGPVTLTVLASSSLTEVFGEMGAAYRQSHPGVRLRPEFGGSAEMAERLAEHDPGDVLATADTVSLNQADRYLDGHRRAIARTGLTIAVGPGNPGRVRGLADLERRGLRVVAGAASVPIGRYTRQAFAKAGVSVRTSAEEISSRAVLDQIRTGDADAGVVYITDLRSAGIAVTSVPIPANENVTVTYSAAAVKDGPHEEDADEFVSWLVTPEAQRLFNKYGFATPVAPQ
ncbi:molybdate ABC transporter substrate-binding protein [Actinomadura opuntiae]|uniref:molybdate ABC transporter substrate-binding protein n=1 Tax=Actinomadura sp. OS1-43 TaxID=604315 RepID=UPI00255AFE4D|nr:molybdate ABC transporter substrate-binding protein [Actinomadura sp. OS1-43]MDL4818150.1 molybdate ABC transporter substrate-binding protein [Actinomadura sp. OS1-43]